MPVYKYFGYPARFHGKPLFHILCHLKVGENYCEIESRVELKSLDRSLEKVVSWFAVLMRWNLTTPVNLLSTGFCGHR